MFLLVFYAVARPRRALQAAGVAVVAFIGLLTVFYPSPIELFFPRLYGNMQFTDAVTFERYRAKTLYDGSNFFRPSYALSLEHLWDLVYMYVFAGNVAFLVLLPVLAIRGRAGVRWFQRARLRDPRRLMIAVIAAWQLVYLVFYIARLGPRKDIDLFFSTFILVAYVVGSMADRLVERKLLSNGGVLTLTGAALGGTTIALVYAVVLGLPAWP
jgi:hypothetical protein